jgi:predicted outer membrane protein
MKKLNIFGMAAVMAAMGGGAAFGQTALKGGDQEIVAQLHQANQAEVAMGRYVQTRASAAETRDLAAMLIQHHGAADERLLAYAQRKRMNMSVIGRPGDAKAQGALATRDLTNARVGEIDYIYAQKMVAEHQAAIDMATSAQKIARDAELKALIGELLPTLREHLASSQRLASSLPEPAARTVQLPDSPAGVSRSNTGADEQRGVFQIPAP